MRDRAIREPAGREPRLSFGLVFVFLFLSAGIVAGGILSFRNYERQYRRQVEKQLSAIADLKVSEIVQWRKERLGDAAVFLHDEPFVEFIRGLVDNPGDADLKSRILSLLGIIRTSYQYDRILLVDARGETLLSVPEPAEASPAGGMPGLAGILASGRITFLDLHRDAPGRPVHMALVVPLFKESPPTEPLGAVILRIDPEAFLYPYIRRWPTPSETAETLLVRREGDEVLFLNELRFKPGPPLSVRAPLTDKSLPAAAAVLGHVGLMSGKDYRGVPVLADVLPVPDSPWFLVARMDAAEVFGPLRERRWLVIGLIGALLFGTGAAVLGWWRRQRARFFRERYETAKKLYDVSARQEALLSAIPDIIMEVDAEKKYVWANPAGLDFFGEGVVGRGAEDYFEGEQEIYRTVQPLFDGQENVIYVESWQRRKDGAKRLLAWWCRVLKDERGRVTGALSSGRDITEQKRAADTLKESEEKFRSLFQSMPQGVVYQDADGRILTANPAAERLLGLSLDQMQGRTSVDPRWRAIHEDGSEFPGETHASMVALATGKEARDFIMGVFNPQRNAYAWLDISATPQFRPGESRPFQVFTTFEDITERRKVEEELRRSEAFLGSVIDNSPLAMWVSDENGTMIKMNPATGKLLHVTPDELVGKYNVLRDDIVEDQGQMPRVREVFEKGLTARFPLTYDMARLRQLKFTGRASVILDITISPVIGIDGRVTNAVIQLVDITERVRAEEALRASLKEKEVLLREIHHRVKNNMQVISSLLNLQGAQVADPVVKEVFRASQLRIRSMALVHERLYGSGDLSRIDFADYLRKLYAHLGQAFAVASDRIGIRFDLEEIPLDINSAIPCGLIATELIANAMKHAFPEGRRGTVTIGLARAGEGRIRMTISDDGVGFPPQVDFRNTDSLGMQIVNLLSQQIEGRVELAAGPGTSFSVDFPEVLYKKRL